MKTNWTWVGWRQKKFQLWGFFFFLYKMLIMGELKRNVLSQDEFPNMVESRQHPGCSLACSLGWMSVSGCQDRPSIYHRAWGPGTSGPQESGRGLQILESLWFSKTQKCRPLGPIFGFSENKPSRNFLFLFTSWENVLGTPIFVLRVS